MRRLILGVLLASMALGLLLVKAQAEESSSSDSKAGIGASNEWATLVQAVVRSEQQFTFHAGLAQAIGLHGETTARKCHVTINLRDDGADDRDAYVIYSPETNVDDSAKRVECVYLHRGHSSKRELKAQYFRVSPDGQLEQAVTLQNKRDAKGKDIRESRTRIEEDIQDPQIQKQFKSEMAYWLKDWLKSQRNGKSEPARVETTK